MASADVSLIQMRADSIPQRSVKEALAELELKALLLQDERDYFLSLEATTTRAYDHHRRELQTLLIKEREMFTRSQQDLEDRLRSILLDNSKREYQLKSARLDHSDRITRRIEEEKAANKAKIHHLVTEVDEMRRSALKKQEENSILKGKIRRLEEDIRELIKVQDKWRAEASRRKSENMRMMRRQNAEQERLSKPFIPSGRTNVAPAGAGIEYAPSTYNVNAVIQTIENRNFTQPSENRNLCAKMKSQTDEVCKSVLAEIMDLRLEYDLLSEKLPSPNVDTLGVSQRLREILVQIEQKKACLKNIRSHHIKIGDEMKLQMVLKDIVNENNVCEKLYSDLMQILRTPYE